MFRPAFGIRVLLPLFLGGLLPFIQSQAFSNSNLCGPEALYVAICSLKPNQAPGSFADFRRTLPKATDDGYSMATLQAVAQNFGLHAEVMRLSIDELVQYVEFNLVVLRLSRAGSHHFVLCEGANRETFHLFDSQQLQHYVSRNTLNSRWSGECLVLSDGPPRFDYEWTIGGLAWGNDYCPWNIYLYLESSEIRRLPSRDFGDLWWLQSLGKERIMARPNVNLHRSRTIDC